jgi:hypothetical protein
MESDLSGGLYCPRNACAAIVSSFINPWKTEVHLLLNAYINLVPILKETIRPIKRHRFNARERQPKHETK